MGLVLLEALALARDMGLRMAAPIVWSRRVSPHESPLRLCRLCWWGSVMGVPLPLLSRGNGDTFAAHLQQIGPRRVSDVSRASPGPDVQPICPNPVASRAQLAQKCTRCIRATDVSGFPIIGGKNCPAGVQMCQDLTPPQTDGPPSPL